MKHVVLCCGLVVVVYRFYYYYVLKLSFFYTPLSRCNKHNTGVLKSTFDYLCYIILEIIFSNAFSSYPIIGKNSFQKLIVKDIWMEIPLKQTYMVIKLMCFSELMAFRYLNDFDHVDIQLRSIYLFKPHIIS